MIITNQFVDAAGTPINGTMVIEGINGVLEATVVNGRVDGSLDPDEYTVAVSAGGQIVFGPHKARLGNDGLLLIRREIK